MIRMWWPFAGIGFMGLLLAGWVAMRLGSAHAAVVDAEARSQAQIRDLIRLEGMRSRESHVVTKKRAGTDLVSKVRSALTSAGLPTSSFNGIQPLSDQIDPVSHIQQRSVQVRLSGLKPADLGAWIAAWQTADQAWGISGLALTHTLETALGADLDNNRFAVTVTLLIRCVEDIP